MTQLISTKLGNQNTVVLMPVSFFVALLKNLSIDFYIRITDNQLPVPVILTGDPYNFCRNDLLVYMTRGSLLYDTVAHNQPRPAYYILPHPVNYCETISKNNLPGSVKNNGTGSWLPGILP